MARAAGVRWRGAPYAETVGLTLWADGPGAVLLQGRAVQQRVDPRGLATPDLIAWRWVTLRDDLIAQYAGHAPEGGIDKVMADYLSDVAARYPSEVARQLVRSGRADPETWGATPDAVAGVEAAMRMVDELAGG